MMPILSTAMNSLRSRFLPQTAFLRRLARLAALLIVATFIHSASAGITFTAGPVINSLGQYGAGGDIATGDLNGDGTNDIVSTKRFVDQDQIDVQLRDAQGNFVSGYQFTGGAPDKCAIRLADLNHDGKLDLLVTEFYHGMLLVRLGNGDGTFGAEASFQAAPNRAGYLTLEVGDIDGDGNLDAVTGHYYEGIRILYGTGTGSFRPTAFTYDAGGGVNNLVLVDLDGDNELEVAWAPRVSAGAINVLSELRRTPMAKAIVINGFVPYEIKFLTIARVPAGGTVFALIENSQDTSGRLVVGRNLRTPEGFSALVSGFKGSGREI